ncbi:hypothetical protein [Curtobacterium sp. SORGH_AS_0776]|uniref:hypothetical protein n=1 Tax=Curtobacterium sp. SORGH_AS_0776 TaxID=3041798 RepID=UPI0028576CA7|nr:hypothetical protein [Curtobacterium sp. SORGH_AS_0776]MDR6172512.1 hypothetical protein [Curtobacterium sp. SORGH_AS_0776]
MERVVGWSTVAVIVVVTVLWLVMVQVTSCSDAAPGQGTSSCETEPVLGVAGSWIAGAAGARRRRPRGLAGRPGCTVRRAGRRLSPLDPG